MKQLSPLILRHTSDLEPLIIALSLGIIVFSTIFQYSICFTSLLLQGFTLLGLHLSVEGQSALVTKLEQSRDGVYLKDSHVFVGCSHSFFLAIVLNE